MDYITRKTTILKYLKKNLSKKRLEHCLNVSKLAVELAKKHNADPLKAEIAGLLHDCTKNKSDREQILFFKKRSKIKEFDLIAKNNPQLLHSYSAAIVSKEEFNIKDKDILNAVANHTLGNKNMSLLEKIIYVADSASFERECSNALSIRKLAKKNIERAFVEVMKNKIGYVLREEFWICPKCADVWNFYVKNKK
ncbi:MAG: bis(5'-nucleosyl)-tetraphosphatase (symmetrical) YqeK [Elusimicrobiota bacterium]|jgi:predicted HD superfamily hydrolase involved in NAD metabolism|nr:bis(5'-nucleosyl)-tetraphosphatase (symmetrical) YqeK [Elusimicrobiota bacterium]